jgi:hypothetical protein
MLAMNAPSTNQEIDMSDIGSDPGLTHAPAVYGSPSRAGDAIVGDRARAVFGQVMGLVALTVGCAALGAYIGRDLSSGTGIVAFIACPPGLSAGGCEQGRDEQHCVYRLTRRHDQP